MLRAAATKEGQETNKRYYPKTLSDAVFEAARHSRLPRITPLQGKQQHSRDAGDTEVEEKRLKLEVTKTREVRDYARRYVEDKSRQWRGWKNSGWTDETRSKYEFAVHLSFAHRALIVVVRPNEDWTAVEHEFNTEWPDYEALRRHRVLCVCKLPNTSDRYEPWVPRPYVNGPGADAAHASVGEWVQHLAKQVMREELGEAAVADRAGSARARAALHAERAAAAATAADKAAWTRRRRQEGRERRQRRSGSGRGRKSRRKWRKTDWTRRIWLRWMLRMRRRMRRMRRNVAEAERRRRGGGDSGVIAAQEATTAATTAAGAGSDSGGGGERRRRRRGTAAERGETWLRRMAEEQATASGD